MQATVFSIKPSSTNEANDVVTFKLDSYEEVVAGLGATRVTALIGHVVKKGTCTLEPGAEIELPMDHFEVRTTTYESTKPGEEGKLRTGRWLHKRL